MKIVVVGSNGQLGAELCRQLARIQNSVPLLRRSSAGGNSKHCLPFRQAVAHRGEKWGLNDMAVGLDLPDFDLTRRTDVIDRFAELQPQVIINTAAYTQVDRAEELSDLCHSVNVDGVANLVEAAAVLKCTLIQISTDYVFDRDVGRKTPFKETDVANPRGVYARTKLEGERLTSKIERHFIVRTCGLYGQREPTSGDNFVDTMLRLALRGDPIRVVDDQHCTPSYVPHVARAVRFLMETDAYGTYHVVNSGETTWYDFAGEIFRQADLSPNLLPITTTEYAARAPRPQYSVLDTSKYNSLPSAPPLPSWQQAIAEYLKSHRLNTDKEEKER